MKEELQSGVEAANAQAADYQKCMYSLLHHYIILNPQVVCVFREQYIRNMPVFSLPLFYVFMYAVLRLSFFEKNNKTCVCVCFSAAGGGEDQCRHKKRCSRGNRE